MRQVGYYQVFVTRCKLNKVSNTVYGTNCNTWCQKNLCFTIPCTVNKTSICSIILNYAHILMLLLCYGALPQTVHTAAFIQIFYKPSIIIFISEIFKYLGITLTNQNYIQEEIKSRLKSVNACYNL